MNEKATSDTEIYIPPDDSAGDSDTDTRVYGDPDAETTIPSYCPACGSSLAEYDDVSFCPACGRSV